MATAPGTPNTHPGWPWRRQVQPLLWIDGDAWAFSAVTLVPDRPARRRDFRTLAVVVKLVTIAAQVENGQREPNDSGGQDGVGDRSRSRARSRVRGRRGARRGQRGHRSA